MAKKSNGTRSELLHCDNCGEEYSSTYKRCPFCGARADRSSLSQPTNRFDLGDRGDRGASSRSSASRSPAPDDDDYVFDGSGVFDDEGEDDDMAYTGRRGGKRLADDDFVLTPTTIAGIIFSLAVVIAAILIVVNVVLPMVRENQDPSGSGNPSDPVLPTSQSPAPSDPQPDTTDDPLSSDSPSPSDVVEPSPSPSTPVPDNQPTSFFLIYTGQRDKTKPITDFTISDQWPDPIQLKAVFTPSTATSTVTWTSSKPEVATVSANGLVTGVKKGTCVITATLENGLTQTCKVDVRISGNAAASSSPAPSTSASPSPSPSASSSASLTLNYSDITISDQYPDPIQLRASNAEGTVTWVSSNSQIATVSDNGTVTRVGKGTCTITATDANGATGKCTVRCS